LNKIELKKIMYREKELTFFGNYNRYIYGKDVANWKKKHGNKIILSKIEIPSWLKYGG